MSAGQESDDYFRHIRESLEADKRDAARYRWIRERGAWETEEYLNGLTPEQYDAAVDAAMSAEGTTK